VNRPTARAVLALALGVTLASSVFSACGNDTDARASRRRVYRSLADDVIVPDYDRLSAGAAELAASVAALCDAPSTERAAAARHAWTRAWRDWNRLRPFRFGPLTDRRTVSDVAFMVDPDKINAVLAGAEPAVGPPFTNESLAAAGADVRGLATVEHLLFGRDPTDAETCAYAAAAAALVADATAEARAAWVDGVGGDPPFADELASPGGHYVDSQAVLDDLVNGMTMSVSEMSNDLARAGVAQDGSRDPSGHLGDRIRDTLAGVRAAYLGAPGAAAGSGGVGALVTAAASGTDARVRDRLDATRPAVAPLPSDLDRATSGEIRRAFTRVRALGTVLRAEVASLLGVTLSLSDADGDS
jgi:predicted lipoprotein